MRAMVGGARRSSTAQSTRAGARAARRLGLARGDAPHGGQSDLRVELPGAYPERDPSLQEEAHATLERDRREGTRAQARVLLVGLADQDELGYAAHRPSTSLRVRSRTVCASPIRSGAT